MDRITFMNTSYIQGAFFEETNLQEKFEEQDLNKMLQKTKKLQSDIFEIEEVKSSFSQEFDLHIQDFFKKCQKQLHYQHNFSLYQNPYKESFEMEEFQTPHIDEASMSSHSSSNQISIDEKYEIIPLQKSFMSFGLQSIQKKDAQSLGQQQQQNFFIQID